MAEYHLIFVRMLFDIRFKVEYFDSKPSFFCFFYFLTKVTEICDSLRQQISKQDPASLKFASNHLNTKRFFNFRIPG